MKVKPILSIIILSYNTKELLRNTISSIYQSEKNLSFFEIIVFDNNSQDQSVEMVKRNFPKVKLMISKKNLGFGKGNNQAAQKAQGKYLLFLNSDTIIKNKALGEMVGFIDANSQIGILGPKLVLKSGAIQPHFIGYKLNLAQVFKNRIAKILFILGFQSLWLSRLSLEYWDWQKPKEVDWVTGAAILIKKELFKKLNGFDLNFFMYFEDQDLCLRAKKQKFEIWVLPKAKIIHLGGKSIKLDANRKKYYYQSQDYFFKKHFTGIEYLLMKVISLPYRMRVLRK